MLAGCLATAGWAQPKRVLVVSVTKEFRHDVIPAANEMLGQLAQSSGKFTVDYVKDEKDMAAQMTADALSKYDGVVFNNTSGMLPLPDRDAFIQWVQSGKGFVGLHAATDTLKDFAPYVEMIGAKFKTHGPQVEVEVINQDPKHPAGRPFGASFKIHDEIYQFSDFHRNTVRGLLTMDKHPNAGVPGDYPVAWCKNFGQGRVFYTSLGHRTDVIQRAEVQQHVLGGILWSLGLEKGSGTPQSARARLSKQEAQDGFKLLFNGEDLTGWKLRNPDGRASWTAQNRMLVNEVTDKEHGTDLVTEEKFWNFTVRYEFMVPKGANSGFYLRGRYEIQIMDDGDAKQPTRSSNGALYNFAAPAQFASRKAGEWQQVEATIQDNRVTVLLNDVKIHDNVQVDRPTGGELDNKVKEPGPIFVQGDHGSIAFRNMRIKVLP